MPSITQAIDIRAPRQRVWTLLADLGAVADYSPNVRASHWESEQRTGVGAARHCDIAPRGYAKERATRWSEGRGYTLEVYEGLPPIFSGLVVDFVLSDGANQGTRVQQTMTFTLKGGLLGSLFAWPLRGQFANAIAHNLRGLRASSEKPESTVG